MKTVCSIKTCRKVYKDDGRNDRRISHGYCYFHYLDTCDRMDDLLFHEWVVYKVLRFLRGDILGWTVIGITAAYLIGQIGRACGR